MTYQRCDGCGRVLLHVGGELRCCTVGCASVCEPRWSHHWNGGFDKRCPCCRELGAACDDATGTAA